MASIFGTSKVCRLCGKTQVADIPAYLSVTGKNRDRENTVTVPICKSCQDSIPVNLYSQKPTTLEYDILEFTPSEFPTPDTFCFLWDSLTDRRGEKFRASLPLLNSATNLTDAVRQFRIYNTSDWATINATMSEKLADIFHMNGFSYSYSMRNVDWKFIVDLVWKKKSKYNENQVRTLFGEAISDDGYTDFVMIVATDDEYVDRRIQQLTSYSVVFDEVFEFDDVESACKKLWQLHHYSHNYPATCGIGIYTTLYTNVSCKQLKSTYSLSGDNNGGSDFYYSAEMSR